MKIVQNQIKVFTMTAHYFINNFLRNIQKRFIIYSFSMVQKILFER